MDLGIGQVVRRQVERFRIPVDSFNPSMYYIVSFDYESCRPTVQELTLLRDFQEYKIRTVYNEEYARKILAKPFPADGGHNTIIFRKFGPGSWGFRRLTWDVGPLFVPWPTMRNFNPLDLSMLFDRIETMVDCIYKPWIDWKAQRPALYGRS